ncbi:MAG: hypothetical protein ACYDHP_00485 [Ferrimicrobium sp.]
MNRTQVPVVRRLEGHTVAVAPIKGSLQRGKLLSVSGGVHPSLWMVVEGGFDYVVYLDEVIQIQDLDL